MDSYVSFVIDLTEGTHRSLRRELRDIDVSPETVSTAQLHKQSEQWRRDADIMHSGGGCLL